MLCLLAHKQHQNRCPESRIEASVESLSRTNISNMSAVPTAKKTWTLVKLYGALRDLPELIPLGILLGGAVGAAMYTSRRVYFSIAGEQFPDKEMRRDMERQISYGQEFIKPSVFWHVAQWKRSKEDGSLDVAVWPFSNRAYRHDHELPTHPPARQGVPHEGPSPTEY